MGSFIKSMDQLRQTVGGKTIFFDAEMLTVYWETKAEIIEKILPPGLKPGPLPLVSAFIANYPRTSFCPPYKEAGLFTLAEKDGVLGNYCLSMPITDGMAMAMGREICGLPKKMADIELTCEHNKFEGSITRNGIEFFKVTGDINNAMNDANGIRIVNQYIGDGVPMYNIKYSKAIDGSGFDLPPTLVRQKLTYSNKREVNATCDISFKASEHDPWIELEVVKLLGGIYTAGDNTLEKGEILEQVNVAQYLPYSYIKWDWWLK